MAYDAEERETESKKLDALTAISVAISSLGASLTIMVAENYKQTAAIAILDQKIDLIMDKLSVTRL